MTESESTSSQSSEPSGFSRFEGALSDLPAEQRATLVTVFSAWMTGGETKAGEVLTTAQPETHAAWRRITQGEDGPRPRKEVVTDYRDYLTSRAEETSNRIGKIQSRLRQQPPKA